eukprot:scaffold625_cov324-Pavlova_lutheri.AAC.29
MPSSRGVGKGLEPWMTQDGEECGWRKCGPTRRANKEGARDKKGLGKNTATKILCKATAHVPRDVAL